MTRRDRPGDGDLPPDPWAGLADAPSEPPPPPDPGDAVDRSWSRPADPRGRDPDAEDVDRDPGPQLPGRRSEAGGGEPRRYDLEAAAAHPAGSQRRSSSLLGHPAIWVTVAALALLALWTAWMDRPAAPPPPPQEATLEAAPHR